MEQAGGCMHVSVSVRVGMHTHVRVCVTVIFCGVPVWCCFASAETVWTVGAWALLGYHYVAYWDLGQELSGDN